MDDQVMELLRSGRQDEAFAQLVTLYRRKAIGLGYSLLGNRQAAEDSAQEAFMKIWRALPGFDGRASLSTWIYTIVRNTALSMLRSRRAEISLSDPAVLEAAEAASAHFDADDSDKGNVERLVAALPDRQRAVVTLYYLEDKSVDEVASLLGMPEGTVKTLLHRARARLAQAIGPREPAVAGEN
jgi:RNA polymerase sigma-70 factor (ECF subfamily)